MPTIDMTKTPKEGPEALVHPLDFSSYDADGFRTECAAAISKYEDEANAGAREARLDWIKFVGTEPNFGRVNALNGHFAALVIPLCLPGRLHWVSYIFDYAFAADDDIDAEINVGRRDKSKELSTKHGPGHAERQTADSTLGRKQMQAKMMFHMLAIDKTCAERSFRMWDKMCMHSLRNQSQDFRNMDEYMAFRVIDVGGEFTESFLCWGMGIEITKEEDVELSNVRFPLFATLTLANDYFSFDVEHDELKKCGGTRLKNAVWLCMQWHHIDVTAAKGMVRAKALEYEKQFHSMREDHRRQHGPLSDKLERYLNALQYMVTGNIIWSLNCPRYHPARRYDRDICYEEPVVVKAGKTVGSTPKSKPSTGNGINIARRGISGNSGRSLLTNGIAGKDSSSDDGTTSDSSDCDTCDDDAELLAESFSKITLDPNLIQAPCQYVDSLPAKGVRDTVINALNVWFEVPKQRLETIKTVTNLLHIASLVLDDIQDGSELRRSKPAAHTVFGVAQSINSANHAMIEAVKAANDLNDPEALSIVLEEMPNLHVGQAYDLHWTRHVICPTEAEYMEMVSNKTGGLFRLLARLIMLNEPHEGLKSSVIQLMEVIGRHSQIRDDYQNLQSAEYTSQKGFCDDLDEGKLSFPIIHHLSQDDTSCEIRELLRSRQETGSMSKEMKLHALELLEKSGSLEYTKETLRRLQTQIEAQIRKIEKITNTENWILRLLVHKLSL